MKIIEKEKARDLRKQGNSINEITQKTGFSKASVSAWVSDIVLSELQKKRISRRGRSFESIERRRKNRLFNENQKRQRIVDEAKKSYREISQKELKLIGAVLYLGEGAKTRRSMVRIANSDPMVIKIMMRFFREVCKVPESKFRAHIHTFSHADLEQTEKYWSTVSGIPRNQFFKTYTKPSRASLQKRNTLPFGTFDIVICDTKLFLIIMGWIERIKELTLNYR